MPRRSQVRYYASRGAYYTQIDRRQYKLADGPDDFPDGPNYQVAVRAYAQLLENRNVPVAKDRSPIRAILEAYADHLESTRAPATLRIKREVLAAFVADMGNRPVGGLTHGDIDRFIASMRAPRQHARWPGRTTTWGSSSVALFLKSLKSALNWGVKRKYIQANPLDGYDVPVIKSRSVQTIITPEDHERVLKATGSKRIGFLIVALHHTGARPGELRNAAVRDWDDVLGAIVFHGDDTRREDDFRHKTAGKCVDRVIRFKDGPLAMMRRLIAERRRGPIFVTKFGRKWSEHALHVQWWKLREKLNLPYFIPYSYRHTFATEWLTAGHNIELLAEILGNSTETIRRHYRHITPRSKAVEAAFQEFRGGK